MRAHLAFRPTTIMVGGACATGDQLQLSKRQERCFRPLWLPWPSAEPRRRRRAGADRLELTAHPLAAAISGRPCKGGVGVSKTTVFEKHERV